MSSSVFKKLKVSVRLHVLRVSCPGVCLSGRSDLVLRVWLLGQALRTSPAPPSFPLRFDYTFNLSHIFESGDLSGLHALLAGEGVRAELAEALPGLRPLATFHCSLLTLLFPSGPATTSAAPTTLRMQPLRHFPGVLGPELEVSTWTSVQQVALPASSFLHQHRACSLPKKIPSLEPSECRSLGEVRRCVRSAHSATSSSPAKSQRPPFVVRHVDQDIFKLTPRFNLCRSNSRSRRRLSMDSHYNVRNESTESEHAHGHAGCACSVCCLYEEYFGRPYPQHCPAEEDEGVADVTLDPRPCCCCCPQNN